MSGTAAPAQVMRRLGVVVGVTCCLLFTPDGLAQSGPAPEPTDEQLGMTPATRHAIQRGLDYFAACQNADGSFRGSHGAGPGIVSFAVLSFLSTGQMPGRGPRGEQIARSVEFVLDQAAPNGLISNPHDRSSGPMYEHAMSVLMLAELAGDYEHPRLSSVLHRGVQLILRAQNRTGGWRYQPNSTDADLSVTAMQVIALRAARDAGITVPGATIDAAANYIRRCATPSGGFLYQPGRGEAAYSRTGAAVCALLAVRQEAAVETRRGIEYLQAQKRQRGPIYPFYGLYYASHAMYLAPDPDEWPAWFPPIREELITSQADDGHWDGEAGPLYGTAMAVLTLSVPLRQLPVFQR